jgi:hypothetical protein
MSERLDTVDEVRRLFRQIFVSKNSERKSGDEPILVSSDLAHGNKKGLSAIRLSIVDTRSFAGVETRKLKSHQHTHSLLWTGTYILQYGPQGVRLAQKRALFHGIAQKVTATDRMSLLRHLFCYFEEEDIEPCCQSQKFRPFQSPGRDPQSFIESAICARLIVVVGHSVPQDIHPLSKVGFEITQVAP